MHKSIPEILIVIFKSKIYFFEILTTEICRFMLLIVNLLPGFRKFGLIGNFIFSRTVRDQLFRQN